MRWVCAVRLRTYKNDIQSVLHDNGNFEQSRTFELHAIIQDMAFTNKFAKKRSLTGFKYNVYGVWDNASQLKHPILQICTPVRVKFIERTLWPVFVLPLLHLKFNSKEAFFFGSYGSFHLYRSCNFQLYPFCERCKGWCTMRFPQVLRRVNNTGTPTLILIEKGIQSVRRAVLNMMSLQCGHYEQLQLKRGSK